MLLNNNKISRIMKTLILSLFTFFASLGTVSIIQDLHTDCECSGLFCGCDIDCAEGSGTVADCNCGAFTCDCECSEALVIDPGSGGNDGPTTFPPIVHVDRLEKVQKYFDDNSQGNDTYKSRIVIKIFLYFF